MKKYAFIGNDNRTKALRQLYLNDGVEITTFDKADYVITTIPFTRDGKYITGEDILCDDLISTSQNKIIFTGALSDTFKEKFEKCRCYDLMSYENVAIKNAIPTAEGAIYEAIALSNKTIFDSNCLVLGFGRIGKILSKMLQGIGANVFCEARKQIDLSYIESYGYNAVELSFLDDVLCNMDYIFNTIPSMIIDKKRLEMLKKDVCIIDLASVPGGVDFEEARNKNINVKWALSLPGKVAPMSAAIYLKEQIDKIIKYEIGDKNVY